MTFGPKKKKEVEIEIPLAKPVFTIIMLVGMAMFLSDNHTNWAAAKAFRPNQFWELIVNTENLNLLVANVPVPKIIGHLWWTTFAQLSPWLWVINAFFVWVFGSLVERKLVGWRFPVFLLIGIYAPWYLVYLHAGPFGEKAYIGPSMILFYLLGAYLAYLPKKPFKPQDWVRPTWKIFRDDESAAGYKKTWVSPWLYITIFIIYQGLLQFLMTTSRFDIIAKTKMDFLGNAHQHLLGRGELAVNAFALLPAIETVLMGVLVAYLLVAIYTKPTTKRPGGALQVKVLQHYKELRALDMTHEQAIEGAAKFTAVPLDIAKDWIIKGTAALKEKKQ